MLGAARKGLSASINLRSGYASAKARLDYLVRYGSFYGEAWVRTPTYRWQPEYGAQAGLKLSW